MLLIATAFTALGAFTAGISRIKPFVIVTSGTTFVAIVMFVVMMVMMITFVFT
jgi:hypothetical protein